MSTFDTLIAACVAAAVAGLFMIGVGWYGREQQPQPFRGKIRASGALTASRQRAGKIVMACAAGVVVWLLSGWPVAAVLTVAGVLGVPYFFGAAKVVKRRIERLEALDEWTRRLADSISSGAAAVPALVRSAEHAPGPISREVTALANSLATPRLDRRVALRTFADEIDDSLGDMIALSLEIAVSAQASQRVPDVLRTMAEGVAEEVKARRSIEAGRAGPRNEAKLIVIVQIAFVVLVSLATSYTKEYSTLLGQLVMAALGLVVIAALWMLRRFSTGTLPPRILQESRS